MDPNIFVKVTRLSVVDSSVYLRSTISLDMDLLILEYIKGSKKPAKPSESLTDICGLTEVLQSNLSLALMKHMFDLSFYILQETGLRITVTSPWKDSIKLMLRGSKTSNTIVLQRADTSSIDILLQCNQMQ